MYIYIIYIGSQDQLSVKKVLLSKYAEQLAPSWAAYSCHCEADPERALFTITERWKVEQTCVLRSQA